MAVNNFVNGDYVNNSSILPSSHHETMTSIEMSEITGKSHSDLLKSIRKMELAWTKVTGGKFSLSSYVDPTGRTLPCYEFNRAESMFVSSKFNDEERAKIFLRWILVETGQAMPMYQTVTQTAQPVFSLEDKFKAVELSCKCLRVSKACKARMINTIIEPMGLPVFDYVESVGAALSAKDLLEKHPVYHNGKLLKSAAFNTIMEEHGLIERIKRSTKTGETSFPSLTDKGLKWGKNDEPVNGVRGTTQPRYFVKKFPQLLEELGLLPKGE